ncbi:MAG: glycosyltransferase family 2 protein [Bacteroidota bacterium]
MKVSIVTVCYNSAQTIEDTIRSVLEQKYPEIEYIIIDGGSRDTTLEIVNRYKDRITKVVSEPDKGIYDAINKGIRLATGDIVGVLNSDDFYTDRDVIAEVVKLFTEKQSDCIYGDLQYVDRDEPGKVKRNWVSGEYSEGMFYKGWMPPHPTFFIKNECYKKFGLFNLQLKSAADYELMLRMIHVHKIRTAYLKRVLVKMRVGGKSNVTLLNRIKANREDKLAWNINGVKPKFYTLIMKPLSKLGQFLGR